MAVHTLVPSSRLDGGVRNVLFLCTDNAARSLMAEALLQHWGRGRFRAHSAGSEPALAPHPLTIAVVRRAHLPADALATRSWSDYSRSDAVAMDFIVTLCPYLATVTHPAWPGAPITAHWGIGDPATIVGSEHDRFRAFDRAYREIESRIKLFLSLPVASLDRLTLGREVQRLE
jgi:arsenate reductase